MPFPVPLVPSLCYVSHCPYSVLTVLTKTPVGTDLYINSPPHCRGIHLSNNEKFNPLSRAFCVRILFRLALPLSFSSSLPVCTVIAAAIYTTPHVVCYLSHPYPYRGIGMMSLVLDTYNALLLSAFTPVAA